MKGRIAFERLFTEVVLLFTARKKPKIVRKINKKKFELVGIGSEGRVWNVSKIPGKKRFGAIIKSFTRKQIPLTKRYLAMKIAYELFPQNIPRVTALDLKRFRFRMVKAKADPVLEEYASLGAYYLSTGSKDFKARERLYELYDKAVERMHLDSVAKARQKLIVAGLQGDFAFFNISIKNKKKPLFYEITALHPDQVRKYLKRKNFSKAKKQRIKALLERYEKAGCF